jgi:hypothetical protein
VNRTVRLVLAIGRCPLWLSALLLSYQALTEMNDATERQAAK